ncbi:MAG TPA: hypothetical protein VJZ72_11905 [Candidatus Limnocylindrales bacterium]|nr:hypothetical protein [Candidatus Limnocylindrales bacterium]
MQRGLLAVLVTVVIAGIAAIASYSAGYQAGLIASGGAVVAPIVYGGGFGFLGFFGFLFVLVLLFALFRAFARPRWAGPMGGWGHGGGWGRHGGWDREPWSSADHPIPPAFEELHRRVHEPRSGDTGQPPAAG